MSQIFLSTIHAIATNPTVKVLTILAVVLLCALLAAKEVIRTVEFRRKAAWMQNLDLLIIPLIVAFGLILVMRFLSLLYSG